MTKREVSEEEVFEANDRCNFQEGKMNEITETGALNYHDFHQAREKSEKVKLKELIKKMNQTEFELGKHRIAWAREQWAIAGILTGEERVSRMRK